MAKMMWRDSKMSSRASPYTNKLHYNWRTAYGSDSEPELHEIENVSNFQKKNVELLLRSRAEQSTSAYDSNHPLFVCLFMKNDEWRIDENDTNDEDDDVGKVAAAGSNVT